jgi:catechol 2,3-dioxygenase-like lactoylglutathione lyase family enzyme
MIAYVTIGTNDIDKAVAFYDPTLEALGFKRTFKDGGWAGYGDPANPDAPGVMVCNPFDGMPATSGNGITVGLKAATADQVDAFHAAALANGGTSEGDPGPRPQYGNPNYYLAYVRDPSGNKLSAFCTTHQPG